MCSFVRTDQPPLVCMIILPVAIVKLLIKKSLLLFCVCPQYLSGEEEEEKRRMRRVEGLRDEGDAGSVRPRKKTSIYDVYEPQWSWREGFFTDRDKDIRVTDVPREISR